jgi:signal transduction histidine kinase
LSVYGKERRLSAVVETHLLRIAGEAVANARRHAKANEINVVVDYSPASVRLKVTDDGCGFDPGALDPVVAGHFGLLGMRERAAKTGGALTLRTAPGQGTEVSVEISA